MADKDEIRQRNNIVEVVGAVVALKRRGKSHVGLCPFHQEKTPSFHVDERYQTFKCFGCGVAGDVFTFVEQYQNMTFVEAAEFLARRAGLEFDRRGGASPEKLTERQMLQALNEMGARFFRERLQKAETARDYVSRRGLAHATIERFQIGYAPDSWDALAGYLSVRRQDLALAVTAGLIHPGKTGDYYDVFRNRIMFPIHDEQERIVGFGGRALGESEPKYLNTGDTPLFNKSRTLYGLPFARRKIAAEGKTLLVEGYLDVITCHQAGFENAVATLGTSLTEEHARRLARLAPVAVLIYDADNAGVKATLRASELLEKEGVEVRVVRLPTGEDPDSLLRRGAVAELQRAIDSAVSRVDALVEFARARHPLETEDGRAAFLRDLYRILLEVPESAVCDRHLLQHANLHPYAAHGLPVAVDQMRKELLLRRAQRGKAPPPPGEIGEDPTAQLARRESRLSLLRAAGGEWRAERDGVRASEARKAIQTQYRRERFSPPPDVRPAAPGTGGLTAEQRAERELIRALGDSDWRAAVLRIAGEEDFLTEDGRRLFQFVSARHEEMAAGQMELIDCLDAYEDRAFSLQIRQLLQEIEASAENLPLNEPLLQGSVHTLRKFRTEEIKQRMKQLLSGKQMLGPEDAEQIREYERALRSLHRGDRAGYWNREQKP